MRLVSILRLALLSSLVQGALVFPLRAQNNGSQIGYVYPAGARRGETVRVIVGGRQLQSVEEALISGVGVSARVLDHERPLKPEEAKKMREELAGLRKQTEPPPAPERIAELEEQLAKVSNSAATPALRETVALELTVAADAALGPRDLRLRGRNGLGPPLAFVIGDLPELAFPSVAATTARAEAGSAKAVEKSVSGELKVTPPVVVNGQILPGESDRIRFAGKKGQRLIVAVHARVLIPYLADAVPGWFQAVASLRDAKGSEIAFSDDFRFQPDPVLAYQLSEDGDYTLVVRDALYRGREDFVYRVVIGEVPFVAGVFPLGGVAGTQVDFALNGWNLPAPVRRSPLPKDPGVGPLDLGCCMAATGAVEVEAGDWPEATEIEPASGKSKAQTLAPPVVVNGRIERPGDVDEFAFPAKAGSSVIVEVTARRLRSPLDGILQVLGPDGKIVASNDDCEDKADGLSTHHADPRVSFTPATDGVYRARLADTTGRGGYDYGYRLRVGPPRPDFELRVVPSSVNLRPGGNAKVTVYALRRDGFAGKIALTLKNAPSGWRLGSAEIGEKAEKAEVTLNVSGKVDPGVVSLRMEGAATIEGTETRHEVVPADDRMQAFFYRHLVPAQEWMAAVRGREK